MIRGIDHIALVVRDLDEAVKDYEAILGRTSNWRGLVHGTQHAWFQFPNAAIDLIAAHGSGSNADAFRAEVEKRGEGFWGLGFAVDDLAAARQLLIRRGLPMGEPGTTHSIAADGRTRDWEIAATPARSTSKIAQFFVQQDSARWPNSVPVQDELDAVVELDHVVINTPNPDRALAHYGAKLGLDLRLDRSNEQWGSRLLFFRTGNAVLEIGASLKAPVSDDPDKFGGLAWRVRDADAARVRMDKAGINVSEVRIGRKPGTRVFTVRDRTHGVPTLMLEGNLD